MNSSIQPAAEQRPGTWKPLPDQQIGWLGRVLPAACWPFVQLARIDRPIGWWLLLLPCWWSTALAAIAGRTLPHPGYLILFLVGAIAMRGAGSTYNDIVDRHLDAQVARTRGRPIPSGRVSVGAAKRFIVAQALVGLAVLLCFNRFAIALGIASLALVAIYPFMKRITSWPQIVLGFVFSWGALMGWAAVFGSLALAPALLYLAAILWTMGYDTIYALQDTADDAIVGIGSTARRFGRHVRLGVGLLYGGAIVCAGGAMLAVRAGPLAGVGLMLFALHLAWQIARVRDGSRALALFRSNRDAGLLLFAGLAADAVSQASGWAY